MRSCVVMFSVLLRLLLPRFSMNRLLVFISSAKMVLPISSLDILTVLASIRLAVSFFVVSLSTSSYESVILNVSAIIFLVAESIFIRESPTTILFPA